MSQNGSSAARLPGVPQPGEVLAGKFRVERVLGAGGMGVVVAAHHLALDQRVALKFLLPEMVSQPIVVERFLREARSAAQIQSEHVARVLDVGTLPSGAPYLVIEYLEGNDLAHEIKTRQQLPVTQAVDWLLEACEAVAEAHAAGIVHRDLKPANLFLAKRPNGSVVVKVLDFGISKQRILAAAGQSQVRALTQTSAQLGSPAYMPPEQLKSAKDVDERADIWALGMILQELLTGRIAFSATTLPELHVAVLTEPATPLSVGRPDAPADLEAVVNRCLQKEATQRFANVAELGRALAPFGTAAARASAERITRVIGDGGEISPGADTALATAGQAPTAPGTGVAATAASGPPGAAMSGVRPTPSQNVAAGHGRVAPTVGDPGAQSPYGAGSSGAHPAAGPFPGHAAPWGAGPAPHGHHGAPPHVMTGPGAHPLHHLPPGYPPMPAPHARAPAREGTSTALIVLVVLICVIVLGMGGCMLCLCMGAAAG